MGHEIVKSICIDENQGKVFINSASNNLIPHSFLKQEYSYFSKILSEKGKEFVEIALLKSYEEGNLQGGSNKYQDALKILFYVFSEEYKKFDWRKHNAKWGTPEREAEEKLRESEEFNNLLKKALNYKHSKDKFVLSKNNEGIKVYATKITSRHIFWNREISNARKFNFDSEAEKEKKYFSNSEDWKVEKLI